MTTIHASLNKYTNRRCGVCTTHIPKTPMCAILNISQQIHTSTSCVRYCRNRIATRRTQDQQHSSIHTKHTRRNKTRGNTKFEACHGQLRDLVLVPRIKQDVVAHGGCNILPANLALARCTCCFPVTYLFSRSRWFWSFGLVRFVCVIG